MHKGLLFLSDYTSDVTFNFTGRFKLFQEIHRVANLLHRYSKGLSHNLGEERLHDEPKEGLRPPGVCVGGYKVA